MTQDYEIKPGEIRAGIRAVWRHLQPFKSQVVILSVLGVVSAIVNGSVPYITGRFFDILIQISQGELNVWRSIPLWQVILGFWAIVQIITTLNDWFMDRRKRKIDLESHIGIQVNAFSHLFRLPLSYHKNVHVNGALQKISQAGWRVAAILRNLVNIVPQLLSVVVGLVLAASINAFLSAVLVVGVILYLLLLFKILRSVARVDSESHRSWNEGWDEAAAAVHQIESVKQAATEEYEMKKVDDALLRRTRSIWSKLDHIWSNVGFFQRFIVFLTQLTIFIFSVKFVASGSISIGELVALNSYAAMFFGPFVSLGYSWQVMQNGVIAAAHAEEIFQEPEEKYEPENAVALGKISGAIAFKNASFGYGADQPPVLKNINLEVKPGEVIALVGKSGVGKSTFISLISGYYFPTAGEVLIDGKNTAQVSLTELRQQIAVVPQEVALFNDSLKTNIHYGSFAVTDEQIKAAAEKAHLTEFVEKLPQGYGTLVGERGIKLSVGQKQRVAIARAILRDPKILILDEPTSALDAESEKLITESLAELMAGRTTFIIAHRLSTVRRADRILVFQEGEIVESGTHDELVKKKDGVYRHLYELQIGLHQ